MVDYLPKTPGAPRYSYINKKTHRDFSLEQENCPRALLSAYDSAVRLGADRLSSVLESRTVRVSDLHPRPNMVLCQQEICNLHMRLKLA
jgi:hypothetical protein